MPKSITHVLQIVDMSGSMYDRADDVRGGVNAYVDGLRQDAGGDNLDGREYRLTLTLFDHRYMPLCTAVPLDEVPKLSSENYVPTGSTALCDAIGRTVGEFEAATTLGANDRVLVVIQTDGKENTSREFSRDLIKKLIEDHEKDQRWAFVYLGAGPGAWTQAADMGFQGTRTIHTDASSAATSGTYSGLIATTRSYASGQGADESVTLTAEELRNSGATGEVGS